MRVAPALCLAGAALLAATGLMLNSADLLISAAAAGAIGLTATLSGRLTRLPHPLRSFRRPDARLADRLNYAEEELASVSRELAELRHQRDFDLQLLAGSREPRRQ